MSKERPILFSSSMVRTILEGRKTQTRRIVKLKKEVRFAKFGYTFATPPQHISVRGYHANGEYGESFFKCPYGQPGDRLWVRETWGWCYSAAKDETGRGAEDPKLIDYRATPHEATAHLIRWRPSIHMPRWASRITLEVVGVRVERLQEISAGGAEAEGWGGWHNSTVEGDDPNCAGNGPRTWFKKLWESIHGPGSWERNDWVWVVEFKRITP